MKKQTFVIGGVVISLLNLNNPVHSYLNHLFGRRYHYNSYARCEYQNSPSTLKMAQVFFRHGRRTPLLKKFQIEGVKWPAELTETTLPYTNFNYVIQNVAKYTQLRPSLLDIMDQKNGPLDGGAKKGCLTTYGQEDSYNLGKNLRKRYVDTNFVDSSFKNSQVRVYSTNLSRSLLTGRCVLAGMFDAEKSEVANIYTCMNEAEYHYPNYMFCTPYKEAYEKDKSMENSLPQIISKKKHVADILGLNVDEMPSVLDLWEEINVIKSHGYTLPPAYEAAYETIKKAATELFCWRAFTSRSVFMRFAVGLLLEDIGNLMDDFSTKNSTGQLLYLNSVHDSTLMGLLTALDSFDGVWPNVGTYLSLELHKIDDKYFVKAIYNDQVLALPKSENGFLELKLFYKLIHDHRLYKCNFTKMCGFVPDMRR